MLRTTPVAAHGRQPDFRSGGRRPSTWIGCVLLLPAHAGSAAAAAPAPPYVPADSATELERLPAALLAGRDRLDALRSAWREQPGDPEVAAALARHYLMLARETSDPRFEGYAQATLAPWADDPEPPLELRLLRATLAQRRHEFDRAETDLAAVLRRRPRHAQAWWSLASLHLARGQLVEARSACEALGRVAVSEHGLLCLSEVIALTGQPDRARDLLDTLEPRLPAQAHELRQWLLGVRAEAAWRDGDPEAAEADLRAGLAMPRRDPLLLKLYADLLAHQGRHREILTLLEHETASDALLLRAALAARRLQDPRAEAYIRQLRARFTAAELRGSRLHLVDQARLALELGEPDQALQLAQENWAHQRGIEDAALLLAAARASGREAATAPVRDWLQRHGIRDPRLQGLTDTGGST